MARLTVEDCLSQVENRFELILKAKRRAIDLARGAEPLVPRNNDKPTVLALREIAEGYVPVEAKPKGATVIAEDAFISEPVIAASDDDVAATTVDIVDAEEDLADAEEVTVAVEKTPTADE